MCYDRGVLNAAKTHQGGSTALPTSQTAGGQALMSQEQDASTPAYVSAHAQVDCLFSTR